MNEPPATPCELSIVVPTYGGAQSLPLLWERLARTLDGLGLSWEVVLVDDASPDGTAEVIRSLQAADVRLRCLRLAVNRGQHRATVSGMRAALGSRVVTIDDDLQQAPESIPALLAALDAGAQVAVARFVRSEHPLWRRAGSALAQRLLRARRGRPEVVITSFKAFTRPAIDRLLPAIPEGHFYLGAIMLATIEAKSIVNVDLPHFARQHGRSGYSALRLVRLAIALARDSILRPAG